MKTLNGPNDNVAGVALVRVEAATARCKEAIVRCVSRGGNDDELTKELNKIIANCCNGIEHLPLREQTRKALVTAARRYYYELSETKRRLEPKLAMLTSEMRHKLDDGSNTGIPVIDDYNRKIKIALKALSAEPPMVVKYKDGRVGRYSLRNASEMAARYDANIKDLNNLKGAGVKLVWTTSHPNCSPRCAPWQGRLYSLDGTSGVIDGNRYVPIERAIEANDGNSIINGYNCRHRLIEYFKGSRAPKEHSEAEIKKEYAKDVYQRRMENNIRQMKVNERLLRGWGLDKDASELRKKWRIAQNEYKAESLKMGRPYYPYRYVIDEAEVDYEKWYEAEGLTKPVDGDIIDTRSASSGKIYTID